MKKNRLIEAVESTLVDNAKKLQFTYDYMGRRVQKQVYAWDVASDLWSLTSDLRYVYDGWNLIQTLDAQDSNAGVKGFTWGLDLSQSLQGAGVVGGLLAVTDQSGTGSSAYYVTYDANGNVSEYIDSSGNIIAHYEYSPFGKLTATDGSMAADFNHRFSTKYFDTETRLYYYGFRYYSSELGRWLSRDPIGKDGGWNLYGFVSNNPLVYVDPWGLEEWKNKFLYREEREDLVILHFERGVIAYKCIEEGEYVKLFDSRYDERQEGYLSNVGSEWSETTYGVSMEAGTTLAWVTNQVNSRFTGEESLDYSKEFEAARRQHWGTTDGTYYAGGSLRTVYVGGPDLGVGFYLNPQEAFPLGLYRIFGGGFGGEASVNVETGYVSGDISNFEGDSVNINGNLWVVGGTFIMPFGDSAPITSARPGGGAVSLGPGLGGSVTITNTKTTGSFLEDLMSDYYSSNPSD